MRRYDFDNQVAAVCVTFLQARVDAAIQAAAPIVTFYDPMSIDDASRIIVQCPQGRTMVESPGNADVDVTFVVKTRWTQPTATDDFTTHFSRVNAVRDAIWYGAMADDLNTAAATALQGIGVDFVKPVRNFSTRIFEDGYLVSETSLTVGCYSTDT